MHRAGVAGRRVHPALRLLPVAAVGLAAAAGPAGADPAPAAFAGVAGLARIETATVRQSEEVRKSGPEFALPAEAELEFEDTTGGAFLPFLDWKGRASLVSGPVPLSAQLETAASSAPPPGATEAVASVTATASFLDRLLLEHGGSGPDEGLLTLRFSADARVAVAGTLGPNAQSRFRITATSPRADALLEIEARNGFGLGGFASVLWDFRRYWTERDFAGDGEPGGLVWLSRREDRFDGLGELTFQGYGFDLVLPFVFGEALDYSLSVLCQSVAVTASRVAPQFATTVCEAGNSLHLLGIASITGLDGRPVGGVRLASLSGIPYPLLGGGAVIPEPATWALLVAGFGLAGAGLRRARGQAAAARSAAARSAAGASRRAG